MIRKMFFPIVGMILMTSCGSEPSSENTSEKNIDPKEETSDKVQIDTHIEEPGTIETLDNPVLDQLWTCLQDGFGAFGYDIEEDAKVMERMIFQDSKMTHNATEWKDRIDQLIANQNINPIPGEDRSIFEKYVSQGDVMNQCTQEDIDEIKNLSDSSLDQIQEKINNSYVYTGDAFGDMLGAYRKGLSDAEMMHPYIKWSVMMTCYFRINTL